MTSSPTADTEPDRLTDCPAPALDEQQACRAALRQGSRSFNAAATLLPARVRQPATALYAFCRAMDDAIDKADRPPAALAGLEQRLEQIYRGQPQAFAEDVAFCQVVQEHAIPRAIPAALLEGMRWDVEGRRYADLSGVLDYSARVASTVGVMMTLIMGRRQPQVLARACELGLAMQLTNIARDVGEDARMGRLYLPLDWLRQAGIGADRWLAQPTFIPELRAPVRRLLAVADELYCRADLGIPLLPPSSRVAIRAARLIYADIGRLVRSAGYDSVSRRAVVSGRRKLQLLAAALPAVAAPLRDARLPAPSEVRFLVEAAQVEATKADQ